MRAVEFLTETTDDDVMLHDIAAKIVMNMLRRLERREKILNDPAQNNTKWYEGNNTPAGAVADYFGMSRDPKYQLFGRTRLYIDDVDRADAGGVFYKGKDPKIVIDRELFTDEFDTEQANDAVTHELRHALDYSKSMGRGMGNYDKRDDYMSNRFEINARMTEAQSLMMQQIEEMGDNPNTNELMAIINEVLDTLQITEHVSQQQYKRIVNRMVQYASQ